MHTSFYSWLNELSVVIYETFYKVLGFPYILDNTVLSIIQIKAAVDIIIKYNYPIIITRFIIINKPTCFER